MLSRKKKKKKKEEEAAAVVARHNLLLSDAQLQAHLCDHCHEHARALGAGEG